MMSEGHTVEDVSSNNMWTPNCNAFAAHQRGDESGTTMPPFVIATTPDVSGFTSGGPVLAVEGQASNTPLMTHNHRNSKRPSPRGSKSQTPQGAPASHPTFQSKLTPATPRPPSSTSSTSSRPQTHAGRPSSAVAVPGRPEAKKDVERQETLDSIAQFEVLNRCHLVFTTPSVSKQVCTEGVGDFETAIAKAAMSVNDMRAIGISGLRLTGDHDHEFQFEAADKEEVSASSRDCRNKMTITVKTSAPGSTAAPREGAAAASRRSWSYATTSGIRETETTVDGRASRNATASAYNIPVVAASDTRGGVGVTLDGRTGRKSKTWRDVGDVDETELAIDATESLNSASGSGSHRHKPFPAPTLQSLREERGIAALAASHTSARSVARDDRSNEPSLRSVSQRPVSARVVPSVRQLKMFAAPLSADVPVAPHLQAVMQWCRRADQLRRSECMRHLGSVAEQLAHPTASAHHRLGSPSTTLSDVPFAAFAAAHHHGDFTAAKSTAEHPGGDSSVFPREDSTTSKATVHWGAVKRESRYLEHILREATGGAMEHHLRRFEHLVALWCEHCFKTGASNGTDAADTVAAHQAKFCQNGSMGNTPSRWITFFQRAFQDVFVTQEHGEMLYRLINEAQLEQLTFGRFFFILYIVLGVDHVDVSPHHEHRKGRGGRDGGGGVATRHTSTSMPQAATAASNSPSPRAQYQTHSADQSVSVFGASMGALVTFDEFKNDRCRSSVSGASEVVDVLAAKLQQTSTHTPRSPRYARDSATAKKLFRGAPFPSVLQLWISWAGQTVTKKCRTVNVFHMECVVRSVRSIVQESDFRQGVEDDGTGVVEDELPDVLKACQILQRDVEAFRDAVGTRVEVMLEEAGALLHQHTVLLGPWLLSRAAADCQDELNALVQYAIHAVRDEDRQRQSRAAAADMQQASTATLGSKGAAGRMQRRRSMSGLQSFRKPPKE